MSKAQTSLCGLCIDACKHKKNDTRVASVVTEISKRSPYAPLDCWRRQRLVHTSAIEREKVKSGLFELERDVIVFLWKAPKTEEGALTLKREWWNKQRKIVTGISTRRSMTKVSPDEICIDTAFPLEAKSRKSQGISRKLKYPFKSIPLSYFFSVSDGGEVRKRNCM